MTLDKHTDSDLSRLFFNPPSRQYTTPPPSPRRADMDDDGLQYDSGYDSEVLNMHWGRGRPQMSEQAKHTLAFAKVAPLDFKTPPFVTRPAPRS